MSGGEQARCTQEPGHILSRVPTYVTHDFSLNVEEVVPEHTWLCRWMGVLTECRHRKVGLYYEPDVTEARYFVVFLIHKAKPPVSSPVL